METAKPHSKPGSAAFAARRPAFVVFIALVLVFLSGPNILFRVLFIVLLPVLIHLVYLILSLTALFFRIAGNFTRFSALFSTSCFLPARLRRGFIFCRS